MNAPPWPESVARVRPVPRFLALTEVPGTGPPAESVTVPVMDPVELCASRLPAEATSNRTSAAVAMPQERVPFIPTPLSLAAKFSARRIYETNGPPRASPEGAPAEGASRTC